MANFSGHQITCKYKTRPSFTNSSIHLRWTTLGWIEWVVLHGAVLSNRTWWDIKTRLIFKATFNIRRVWQHLIVAVTLLKAQTVSRQPPILKWSQAIALHPRDMSFNKTSSHISEVYKYLTEATNLNLIPTILSLAANSLEHPLPPQVSTILCLCSRWYSSSSSSNLWPQLHKSTHHLPQTRYISIQKSFLHHPSRKMAFVKRQAFRKKWMHSKIRGLATVLTTLWAPARARRPRFPDNWAKTTIKLLCPQPKSLKWLEASHALRNLWWHKTKLVLLVSVDQSARISVNEGAITSRE